MLGPTAPLGRAGAGEQQEVASPRGNAAMGNGTVLRRERTRRVAGVAVRTSLPVEWRDRGPWHPVTSLAGRCATPSQRDVTTSCTVLMAATRGTAPCANRGPFIVTATGQCMSEFQTENLFPPGSERTVVSLLCSGFSAVALGISVVMEQ